MAENKAIAADAELILRLYDLRREETMRKARQWFGEKFWPKSFEEVQGLFMQWGLQENAYLRQVTSYWDMASALVNRGAIDRGLFYDTNGEGAFVYCKMKPFIAQIRNAMGAPSFLANLEKLMESTPEYRERVQQIEANIKRWTEMQEQQKKGQTAA